jgi:hypothetical protein
VLLSPETLNGFSWRVNASSFVASSAFKFLMDDQKRLADASNCSFTVKGEATVSGRGIVMVRFYEVTATVFVNSVSSKVQNVKQCSRHSLLVR